MTTRAALPHHGTSTSSTGSIGSPVAIARLRRRRRRHLAPALGVLLTMSAFAGCAGDDDAGGGGRGGGPTIGSRESARADGGWLGGTPDFDGASSDGAGDGARSVDASVAESASAAPLSAPASTIAASTAQPSTALQASSVDDNEDYAGFLSYLDRLEAAGIAARPWDPSGRILLRVDAGGRGVPGAKVTVRVAGTQATVAELRTTADGTVRFLPAAYGEVAAQYSFDVDGAQVTAAPGGTVVLVSEAPRPARQATAVDVLFLLDTTGSMGDELSQLTANIATIADNVAAMAPDADLRFGMTLYRDDVDTFTTATYDLTGDIDAFGRALDEVTADGGGDTPEALDEGLAEALAKPSWRPAGEALQLVFVVGDAAPQVGRNVPTPYTESLRDAMARGIKVFPIASSGTDDVAELVFRELAQATGGRFVFLAYGAAGAALGAGTDIGATDYEELSLDQLITRFIAEELTDWTGTAVTVPVPTPTSTTRPPNQ